MAVLNFSTTVTLDELRTNIPLVAAEQTMIIQSEPGCGKSSLLKMIEEDHGDKYDYIYVDCPVKSLEEIGMSVPVHQTKRLEYYVSELFKLDSPKPKMIMLDEFMKSPKLMQVIYTRLMLEHMVGDHALPLGSCVWGTSNNQTDGVGDGVLAHAGNRVTFYRMAKPTAKSWNVWAGANGVSRLIRAWVAMNTRCLASYLDGGQEDNPFIFNPAKQTLSFVSPRSLAKSDVFIKQKNVLGDNFVKASLAGTVGVAAAESIMAFLRVERDLIRVEDVIADPQGVAIPESNAALFMMMFNAVDTVSTQDELSAFMTYVNRLKHEEVRSVFLHMLCGTKRTMTLAKRNAEVSAWYLKNFNLL